MPIFMIFASSVVLAASAPVHSTQIAHQARAYTATYQTEPTVHFNQINPVPAMRQTHATCRWQAELIANRAVATDGAAVPSIGRAIHRFRPLSDTYVGRCQDGEDRVSARVARYLAAKADETAEVARADHGVLSAEIDGIHAFTTQG